MKNNWIVVFLNVLFATFSAFFFSYSFSKNEVFQNFMIVFQEMTYPAIQALFTFPLFNNIVKELKKHHVDQISSKEDIGVINSNFLKINEFRVIINKVFFTYRQLLIVLTMFFHFYKNHEISFFIYNLLFFFLFFLYFIFSQQTLIRKKKEAWCSTEVVLKNLQSNIFNIEDVQQNLISMKSIKILLEKEANSWFVYSTFSNLLLLSYSFFLFFYFFLINPVNVSIGYIYIKNISRFPKNIQTLILYYYDFQFLKSNIFKKNSFSQNYKNLIVSNLIVYNVGPFNFEMKKNILIIRGNNGSGKTAIAKSIAGLIPFKGQISSPNCVYIGLDSFIVEANISRGERVLKHIDLALSKNYSLFILDEVLDILSEKNFNFVLKKLENKKIIIISHKKLSINLPYQTLVI
ncbi:ABC transporter ATP-binding protein [Alphaproteobacteria bacterium endosymbiont of Tiliacea citrago]|uniref:ATP-binding cassette domain-containing protein n=1 Tax=Alphaproteobacteria bacterium endosymbiont of Tiliacea citrago TaxID=3077944 RepID=UPI00313C9E28